MILLFGSITNSVGYYRITVDAATITNLLQLK
jgi:hypothetical protein